MSVQPLDGKCNESREEPLPEGRVPILDSVHQEEKVEESASHPVDEAERNVAKERSERLDAADSHDCEDDENDDASCCWECVFSDASSEGVIGRVYGKGCQVSDQVDHSPEDYASTDDDVKHNWFRQWKHLQVIKEELKMKIISESCDSFGNNSVFTNCCMNQI